MLRSIRDILEPDWHSLADLANELAGYIRAIAFPFAAVAVLIERLVPYADASLADELAGYARFCHRVVAAPAVGLERWAEQIREEVSAAP